MVMITILEAKLCFSSLLITVGLQWNWSQILDLGELDQISMRHMRQPLGALPGSTARPTRTVVPGRLSAARQTAATLGVEPAMFRAGAPNLGSCIFIITIEVGELIYQVGEFAWLIKPFNII